jgi:hypothetical protein
MAPRVTSANTTRHDTTTREGKTGERNHLLFSFCVQFVCILCRVFINFLFLQWSCRIRFVFIYFFFTPPFLSIVLPFPSLFCSLSTSLFSFIIKSLYLLCIHSYMSSFIVCFLPSLPFFFISLWFVFTFLYLFTYIYFLPTLFSLPSLTYFSLSLHLFFHIQGGSNMTGTVCV